MGFCRQLGALIWRNFLLKKRTWGTTLAEVLVPVLVMLIMVGLREAVSISNKSADLQLTNARYFNSTDQAAQIALKDGGTLQIAIAPESLARSLGLVDALTAEYPVFLNTPLGANKFRYFASNDDLHSYCRSSRYGTVDSPYLHFGIVLNTVNTASNQFEYTLRFNVSEGAAGGNKNDGAVQTLLPFTNNLQANYNSQWSIYFERGFLLMQDFMDRFLLRKSMNAAGKTFSQQRLTMAVPFPTPPYITDIFADVVAGSLGLFFTLVYIWPVTRIVKSIVEEKEMRVREGMKIMGMADSPIWLSWLITYSVMFFVTACLIALVTTNTVYKYSNKGYVIAFFWLFGLCVFAFSFMMSTIFSKARVASTTSALVFLGSFFAYYAVDQKDVTQSTKSTGCLAAPICFGLGAGVMSRLESTTTGVTSASVDVLVDNFTYNSAMGMFILDFFLYMLVGLYADRTVKNDWGTSLPWYFCCLPRFWCPPDKSKGENLSNQDDNCYKYGETVEPVSAEVRRKRSIAMRHLRKVYEPSEGSSTPKVAVDDVSLEVFEGQITVLLGHNGAGKTSLINMLTGMLPVSSGDADIRGFSLTHELPQIRENLGLCPQFDILYESLTVAEHLALFAAIKGVNPAEVDANVTEMIKDLGLEEKTNTYAGGLSGGQKRRLSVGIALIGKTPLAILDEPTTGMDVAARRLTFELLMKMKSQGRTIILTTHYLDEADQIGDRIVIMSGGNVECCGSSLFLKNLYGVGYTLTMSKGAQFDEKAIDEAIRTGVSDKAEVLSNVAGELSYRLPFSASATFADLFDQLDKPNNKFGVSSYGISVTTLEEVFLRIAMKEHPNVRPGQKTLKADENKDSKSISGGAITVHVQGRDEKGFEMKEVKGALSPTSANKDKLIFTYRAQEQHGWEPVWRHIRALFMKRFNNAKRDRRVWTWTGLYPFLIALIGVFAITIGSPSQPLMRLTAATYNQPNRVAYNTLAPQYVTNANNMAIPFTNLTAAPTVFSTIDNTALAVMVPTSTSLSTELSQYLIDTLQNGAAGKESRYVAFRYGYNLQSNATAVALFEYADVYFNTTAYHGLPVSLNVLNNAVLRSLSGTNTASITLNSQPLPITASQGNLGNSFVAVIFALAFGFIPSAFVAYVVKERDDKVKHQHMISGVTAFEYWASAWMWDIINYLLPALLCFATLGIWNIKETIGENAGATFLAILLHGFAIIPFGYICSFMFKNHSTAQNTMLLVFFFAGGLLLIASIVLDIIDSTKDYNKHLKYIYRLLPSFCFGEAIANLIVRESPTAFGSPKGIWDMDIVGKPLIFLTWESVAYFVIVLLIEYVHSSPDLIGKFIPNVDVADDSKFNSNAGEPLDPDVAREVQRVEALGDRTEMITIKQLRKVYPPQYQGGNPHLAVERLSLSIPAGECFGFLGVNGAGKTTTLKMLTNDILPTSGEAFLNGLSIISQQQQVRHLLGYCPQFDSLSENLTTREHLMLYGRIKGVPEDILADYCEEMIQFLGLQEGIADKPCKEYSGGNKRKLCVGIALTGNPPIVFLDEPSSGMDPVSRRSMWELISSTMRGRSVILTTHFLEEAEALCQRISIMVNGRLQCIGGAQHLKSRFGADYFVDVNVDAKQQEPLLKFMQQTFPGATVVDQRGDSVKIKLLKENPETKEVLTFGQIFRVLANSLSPFQVREYACSQATLEQIFLKFASKQKPEENQGGGGGAN